MDAVHVGGLGGTFGGNPVACAAGLAVLDELAAPGFAERAEHVGSVLRTRLAEIASRQQLVGEVRGLGPMLALELPEQSGELTTRITREARERGLILLSCGLYGNVIRILVPFAIDDASLERGLDILEELVGS
jgi:4-aminobutyrate aminotransferase-like enzyme